MNVQLPDMTTFTAETLSIFLILLPGFLALRISEMMNPRSEAFKDVFSRVIFGTIFALVVYAFYWGIAVLLATSASQFGWGKWRFPQWPLEFIADKSWFNIGAMISLLGFAGLIGLAAGRIRASKALESLLISVTGFTGKESLWRQCFESFGSQNLVRIRLRDGRSYIGKPHLASTSSTTRELLLFTSDPDDHPILIWHGDKKEKLNGKAVVIAPEAEIESIEFLKAHELE